MQEAGQRAGVHHQRTMPVASKLCGSSKHAADRTAGARRRRPHILVSPPTRKPAAVIRRTTVRTLWIIATLLVLVSALAPLPAAPDLPSYSDKLVHFACYLVLGWLATLAQRRRQAQLLATAGMVVLGVAIECLQGLLPWRSFEWLDMVANGAGVVTGYLLAVAVIGLRRHRRPQLRGVQKSPARTVINAASP